MHNVKPRNEQSRYVKHDAHRHKSTENIIAIGKNKTNLTKFNILKNEMAHSLLSKKVSIALK